MLFGGGGKISRWAIAADAEFGFQNNFAAEEKVNAARLIQLLWKMYFCHGANITEWILAETKTTCAPLGLNFSFL